jgi:hypothetical protein
MTNRLVANLLIIAVAALLGLSIAKVSSSDLLVFTLGGAIIALIAVGIASIFGKNTSSFEEKTPPRNLLGMRIGVVGLLIALCGWFVVVFASALIGRYVVVVGVFTGLIGFPIHFYNLYRKQ